MIVKVPRGEADEKIRKAWLWMTLPCTGTTSSASGALSGKPVDHGVLGYKVPQVAALELLAEQDSAAALWWNQHGYPKPGHVFVFYENEVIVLGSDTAHESWG